MVIHEKIKLGAIAPRLIFSWITISSCGYQVNIKYHEYPLRRAVPKKLAFLADMSMSDPCPLKKNFEGKNMEMYGIF